MYLRLDTELPEIVVSLTDSGVSGSLLSWDQLKVYKIKDVFNLVK